MLFQTLSYYSWRHLLPCKRPYFLTQGSWRGCTIHWGHANKMSVFSAVSVNEPLRSSWSSWTHRFHILQLIMVFLKMGAAVLRAICNPSSLQFNLYQTQIRDDKHFFFLRHNNFSPGKDVQMQFLSDEPAE